MKYFLISALTLVSFLSTWSAEKQFTVIAKVEAKSKVLKRKIKKAAKVRDSQIDNTMQMLKTDNFEEASVKLYRLIRSPRYRERRTEFKYKLGLTLMELKLNQVAAFQFFGLINKGQGGKYIRQSLESLSIAADRLDYDVLLKFAISKVKINEFPSIHRDMLFFRIGEFQMRNGDFKSAVQNFEKIGTDSRFYTNAKYKQGLALAEMKLPRKAVRTFEALIASRDREKVTDDVRVAAMMGKARTLYQAKNWDSAIEAYRQIPRDSRAWHETLFESSWAMLRGKKFRSALSNFHSLHSPYYESTYLPESLVLRAIVYFFICKYSEMEKVLALLERVYGPVYKDLHSYIKVNHSPSRIFADFEKVLDKGLQSNSAGLPFLAANKISKEGDFRRTYRYYQNLLKEKQLMADMSPKWRSSGMGRYADKILRTRLSKSKQRMGGIIRKHLFSIKTELRDLREQANFLKIEMLTGQRKVVKKEMMGQVVDNAQLSEEQNRSRTFYVQNGYDYWPFNGEYWLDELGNYHYLGVSSCQ